MASDSRVNIPIGTSDPLDLSAGLPLLPIGTARAGISASSRSYKLIEFPLLIICVRLKIAVYGGYGFGIVGPAVAFLGKNVDVDRDNIGNVGRVTLTFNDGLRMEAGAFVGAYVAAGVVATAEIWRPKPWWKVWANTWSSLFRIEKDFKVDLLELMYKLIVYLLKQKGSAATFTEDKQNKLEETKLGVKGFGMAGSSTAVTRDLRAEPELTAPLNLANYVPKLREINLALAKIDGGISFGPSAHLQYPVTFNIDGFTVEGGVLNADTADYRDNVQYRNGNQVTATGDRFFNLQQKPSSFTTHVKYGTTVKLSISIHAQIKVAKFFSVGVNTPSLDLTYLLYRIPEPRRTLVVEGSVKTTVGGGCVLTPNMTLRFEGPGGQEIVTGEETRGIVTVMNFQPSTDAIVQLYIQPEVEGFPKTVTIPAGTQSKDFVFTFNNQNVATGDRDDPSHTASPSPTASLQNYLVRAKLQNGPPNLCWDFQAETPLSVANRVIRCPRMPYDAAAPAPPWDADNQAGASLTADIDDPRAPSGGDAVGINVWFPYPPGTPGAKTVPVTFTLLDENREPYGRSDVDLVIGQDRWPLNPSSTQPVRIRTRQEAAGSIGPNAIVHWRSKGQPSGYSNRFFLVIDAGAEFGQNEFWLDVRNWS